ncbi:MAG: UDP-N-acetylmuramoyl-L-alanyl-D-glutamate--2,6-diaminopimelate ligase [Candidatus Sungbacteria bacterium]|nr:UDP-N-acetylmuramoyl-L-alanyl-D-glutamate--2,6-diaminopimelate ligase [Candidatus Sungbacteria bacterium]
MSNSVLALLKKIIPRPIFKMLQPFYHFLLAFFAAFFYLFPSRRLVVIGVTGTDGKSSVVSLLHEIFLKSGYSVASCSSLRFKINESERPNVLKMTMPGRFAVQRFLADARRAGARFAVIEVTSEGIKQFRHRFITFDCAVFTNLTPEHIESHGDFEKYRAAKAKLFEALGSDGIAVLNRDDPAWEFFAKRARAKINFYSTASLVVGGVEFSVSNVSCENEIYFRVSGIDFYSALFGQFNVSNILAAVATARSFGVSFENIAGALKHIKSIPGRLEVLQNEPFRVVVDYAHTPNALRKVYETLRKRSKLSARGGSAFGGQAPRFKLLCVLGAAGGGRDKWKRPELGKIASEFCSEVILTNEDPYDENPQKIIDDVAVGVPISYKLKAKSYIDRREAIREALRLAMPGDTVVITGKGAERFIMGPAGVKIPWDDRQAAKEELMGPK